MLGDFMYTVFDNSGSAQPASDERTHRQKVILKNNKTTRTGGGKLMKALRVEATMLTPRQTYNVLPVGGIWRLQQSSQALKRS